MTAMVLLARGGDPLIAVAIVAGIILLVVLAFWFERRRKRAIHEALRARGFVVQEKERPFDPFEDAPIANNPLLRYKRNAVRWSAMGEHKGNVVRLFEYRFVTGGGKSQQTHVFLFASVELPAGVPEFTIERKRWLMSHRPEIKAEPAPVDDVRISQSFACYTADPTGAAAMLLPAVCDELATWDKNRMLRFGNGFLSIGWRGSPKAAQIDDMLDTLDRVFAATLAGLNAA